MHEWKKMLHWCWYCHCCRWKRTRKKAVVLCFQTNCTRTKICTWWKCAFKRFKKKKERNSSESLKRCYLSFPPFSFCNWMCHVQIIPMNISNHLDKEICILLFICHNKSRNWLFSFLLRISFCTFSHNLKYYRSHLVQFNLFTLQSFSTICNHSYRSHFLLCWKYVQLLEKLIKINPVH